MEKITKAASIILGVFSFFKSLFTSSPNEYNPTNAEIKRRLELEKEVLEMKAKLERDRVATQRIAEESALREADLRKREEEARQEKEKARKQEAESKRREEEAKFAAEQAHEKKRKAEAEAAGAQKRAEESAQREAEFKKREEEARQGEKEAREREADSKRREEEAKLAAEQARLDLEQWRLQVEEFKKREKEANEKLVEANRLAEESKQAALDAQKRESEVNLRVLETQKLVTEAQKAADEARAREEEVQKDLEQAKFYLERGIQPEVWPTKEEFQLAINRIQYDPEKLHFAVCGGSGSGKSSLVNAFRGLKNNLKDSQAAPTGLVETTKVITRYPDPRKELPYGRLVWFDCPGAGTLEIPGWQYFNQQGLFIFDIIILVYDSRFTEIDLCIIRNCERFEIPLFIVRSKADSHIENAMRDAGYDKNDEDAENVFDDYQTQALELLIDGTRKNLEENLEKAKLNKHDVFIVSSSVIFSLVKGKAPKRSPLIDEACLLESILKMAHARRYGTQATAKNHSTVVENNVVGYPS